MLNELFILAKIKEGDIKRLRMFSDVIILLFAGMQQALRVKWRRQRR